MNTALLISHDDDNNKGFLKFKHQRELKPPRDLFTKEDDIFNKVGLVQGFTHDFDSENNHVEIASLNCTYNISHYTGNVDLVLPKPSTPFDWVGLWFHQDDIISKVRWETQCNLKIYGNGNRIMGYDEPMICDIPFASLRLTFVNPLDGWIIV